MHARLLFRGRAVGALTVTALGVLAACGRPTVQGQPVGAGRTRAPRYAVNAFTRKTVSGKEPPTTLLADDGTTCVVTGKRYEKIEVGTRAWCYWRSDDRTP